MRRNRPEPSDTVPTLIPLPAAIDLIRFEKNLLQMGFFGAHDTRHKNLSTRRIEQWVNRNGQKMKVAAEFRGSQELGLPSTSDRDKYLAFMKIAMEQRAKSGQLSNPIRFTGYQMLKELGLTFSGENYDDINRWGQRMADTTITSEQVIYLAARKKYANKTVHVFRSFTRAGESNGDDTGKTDSYEIVLEDWLLENLNQSYVVPEDFSAYRKLKRPTAKGIFGYLHLWFHASHGRPIEKDYAELCILLNIPAYRHVSKIKETMGRSLDELVQVDYLSKWDVKAMLTKTGYKLVLVPGEELLHVLAISHRKQLVDRNAAGQQFTEEQQQAIQALLQRGIAPAKAQSLLRTNSAPDVLDKIEYSEFLTSKGRRRKIENPSGFLIYFIESDTPLPTGFVTRRKLREEEARAQQQCDRDLRSFELECQYNDWVSEQVDSALTSQYPGVKLKHKIKAIVNRRRLDDAKFDGLSPHQQELLVEQALRLEVRDSQPLMSFEAWCKAQGHIGLFR